MNPQYPIYIISKGRADVCYTATTLEYMNVPYTLVVEPQELATYAKHFNSKKIITTPFSNLGQGSIPVRNFVWEHSIKRGAKRHWIMDDNIKYFFRLHENFKIPVNSGTILKAAEDFVDRYTDVKMAGLQYDYFCPRKDKINPFILNTRIYSCILLSNDIDLRWRGRYNEDTDLSIRVLKDGWCTILFNAFLCGKVPTLTMKGGNAEQLYKGDGRLKMALSLQEQHPELVSITHKWNRPQHKVSFTQWKSRLPTLKKGIKIKQAVDEYGLQLLHVPNYYQIFKHEKTSL